ncbi:hypothetical protein C8Q78DRAFT_38276 [Trametes maxima]|nr:hypothetical protein C8Q78DRAFT_38276 [Trametes maxima]
MYDFLNPESVEEFELQVVRKKLTEELVRLEPDAQKEIEELIQFTSEMAFIHDPSARDEMARKIFERTNMVADFVGKIAQAHPITQAVATAVKGALKLELQRMENNAQIATVHTTMTTTVFHLSYLIRVPDSEEKKLESALTVLCKSIAEAVHRFGEFAHTYHIHWHKIYKTVFSIHHKTTLEDFDNQFKKLKEDMNNMFQSVANVQLFKLVNNTNEILRKLEPLDPKEVAARKFMESKGGPDKVMQDPTLLDKMGEILGERITHGMKGIFRDGYAAHLNRHRHHYRMKHDAVSSLLSDTRTDSGPNLAYSRGFLHGFWLGAPKEVSFTLIQDEEFRDLWLKNSWKATIECRLFVEALHEGYYKRLHSDPKDKEAPRITPEDEWTLEYLSRAMYYSAISDVIDDDASGYISALELNSFLQSKRLCLPKWTKPQYLAFWAAGWCNNNVWYYGKINTMVEELVDSMHKVWITPCATRKTIKGIMTSLEHLILAVDCPTINNAQTPPQLARLQEEYRKHEEDTIEANLTKIEGHIVDDPAILTVIEDKRIELHIMPLLYLLTKRLHDSLKGLIRLKKIHPDELTKLEELAESFSVVFSAFDHRLYDLCRGWRFEAKDVGMQVNRYADGLFKKYYSEPKKYHKACKDLRNCLFGEGHRLPRHFRLHLHAQHKSPSEWDTMNTLEQRVRDLEDRLSGRSIAASIFRFFAQRITWSWPGKIKGE